MEAILQENPDTLIFAGNTGNSGNGEAISSSGAASEEIGLFPGLIPHQDGLALIGFSSGVQIEPMGNDMVVG